MTEIEIRFESTDDIRAISAVTTAAFGQELEAQLIDALRAGGESVISMVALDQGILVGHVQFSKLIAPARCVGLGPVSVTPQRQGQGIGAALIRRGLEQAVRDGWQAVFVLGSPAYYGRFGFRVEAAAKFATPYPKEHFMALDLHPGALASRDGAVIYAKPFLVFE